MSYESWVTFMKQSKSRWTTDPFHNGMDGQDFPAFCLNHSDHTEGVYVHVMLDGTVDAGHFEGTIPHIGDAVFNSKWNRKFKDFNEGMARMIERLSLKPFAAGDCVSNMAEPSSVQIRPHSGPRRVQSREGSPALRVGIAQCFGALRRLSMRARLWLLLMVTCSIRSKRSSIRARLSLLVLTRCSTAARRGAALAKRCGLSSVNIVDKTGKLIMSKQR